MKFPKTWLSDLLAEDESLETQVKATYNHFYDWIIHSKTPFFPEYTDHNWSHISDVVVSIASIISDQARLQLSSADAAVIYLSVLFHDCAMHLSEEQFGMILKWELVDELDESQTWAELWELFIEEARRFDGKTLLKLFGDNEAVNRPPEDFKNYTLKDRLLIGEFLRRNHPRIAQEITFKDIPVSKEFKLSLLSIWSDNKDLLSLAGLVAKIHGVKLRSVFEQLEKKYNIREYIGVHAVYLMVVLRIADYIQMQAERAPKQILYIKKFISPFSYKEWELHNSIVDIRNTDTDPEAIFIDVRPDSSEVFFRLKYLFLGFQRELDESWAVLGEVYGRFSGLNQLTIRIRRLKSNLHVLQDFHSDLTYVPVEASFKAADADVIKLLISPLYGDDPNIGIRELLQNGIDSVRDKKYLEESEAVFTKNPLDDDGDVVIRIYQQGDDDYLEIKDKGLGMSSDIITKYFLVAGASYRRSKDWRECFENSEGASQVLRAGRFGVGALAVFLLGNEFSLKTRFHKNAGGLQFKASIDDDQIELRKVSCEIGTTILIKLRKGVRQKIKGDRYWDLHKSWDWFCLETPKVIRYIDNKKLEQGFVIDDSWDSFSYVGGQLISWSYNPSSPSLICNGIIVSRNRSYRARKDCFWRDDLKIPNVFVTDPNGVFPINLQRDAMTTSSYPFINELLQNVVGKLMAFLKEISIAKNNKYSLAVWSEISAFAGWEWHSSSSVSKFCRNLCLTSKGFLYRKNALYKSNEISRLYISRYSSENDFVRIDLSDEDAFIMEEADTLITSIDGYIRWFFEFTTNLEGSDHLEKELPTLKVKGAVCYISKLIYKRCFESNQKLPKFLLRSIEVNKYRDGYIASVGNVDNLYDWLPLSDDMEISEKSFISRVEIIHGTEDTSQSAIVDEWKKTIGGGSIPYAE